MTRTFKRNFSRRLIDGLVTRSIRLGIGPKPRYLLTVVGQRTQTLRTTPVSVVVDGSARYLVAPYGEVGWVRSARAAGFVTLARGGDSERFSIRLLRPGEAGPILRRYLKLEPVMRPYFDVSAEAPAEAFEAEVATHPVFRLAPATSS